MHRILIVEDEVLIGMVLEDILDLLGHTVVGNVASVDEATACLDTLGGGFDCAILDVNLGTDPVFPIADRIAAAGKRIVFATGSHPDSLPERFAADPVLEKPYATAAVEAALEDLAAVA